MLKMNMKFLLLTIGTSYIPFTGWCDYFSDDVGPPQEPSSSYISGNQLEDGQLPGVYNQSACYMCENRWDLFITGNYTWWKWSQGSLQIGSTVPVVDTSVDTITTSTSLFHNPSYASAFQAGAGFNMKGMDNWSIYSEYSWYNNSDKKTVTATSSNPIIFSANYPALHPTSLGQLFAGTYQDAAKIGFQALDFLVQRVFYTGKKLTAQYSTGLMAMWINQRYDRTASTSENISLGETTTNFIAKARQSTWSLGAKFGLDSSWLLGYGLKILGNINQSVLYTSYNASSSESYTRENGTTYTLSAAEYHNKGVLTPVTETFLGFGWGGYFCGNNFHIDLSVGYDFNVYWEYDRMLAASIQQCSNMYLQGLNAQMRFGF